MKSIQSVTRYRIPLQHKDFPLILFWSQKSGCTRWTSWFLFQIDLLEEALATDPWVHTYVNRVFKRRGNYLEDTRKALQTKDKPVVKLVRNPYRRVVSSFLMLSGYGLVTNRAHFAHTEWRKIRQHFYDCPESSKGINFLQFLDFLSHHGVTPGQCEMHFASQFVPGEEDFVTDYVPLESFEKSIRALESRFELRPSPRELFGSMEIANRHHMERRGSFADQIVFNEKTLLQGPAPHYARFLTPAAIAKISRLFATDVERYSYAPLAPQQT